MIYQQNTPEWLELRKKKIGASDAPVIMGTSPYKSIAKLWREKKGLETTPDNIYMQKGREREGLARSYFEDWKSCKWIEPVVVFHKEHDFMMASLDGVDPEWKFGVEIKCPSSPWSWKKLKKDYENGKVSDLYYPQIQHQLECSGLETIYFYVLYIKDETFGEIEYEDFCLPVKKDPVYVEEMIKKEKAFFETLSDEVPPKIDRKKKK